MTAEEQNEIIKQVEKVVRQRAEKLFRHGLIHTTIYTPVHRLWQQANAQAQGTVLVKR